MDSSLTRAVNWFRSQPRMVEQFGAAIRQSFDEVLDGQRTGRYRLDQLSPVEKTYIGTRVEIRTQAAFGLQRGHRMDYLVDGEEVDAKWSIRSRGWMIPREAVGELCLCMTANDDRSTFSVGIVRADDANLWTSTNQDKKRRFNDLGIAAMAWLVNPGVLPENLLLNLSEDARSAILDYDLSGQRRVNQLFRFVHNKVVRREVVQTVAQQQDGPKRVRDARKSLQAEGVIVLGHQGSHPRIAEGLGIEVPRKGSWIATRVVRAKPDETDSVAIGDERWRLATTDDPVCAGPINYQ